VPLLPSGDCAPTLCSCPLNNSISPSRSLKNFLALCLLIPTVARSEEPVTLLYNDRPPYLVSQADGSATGLSATPAANAFKAAGIPFTWSKMPTNRQLAVVKDLAGMYCAVGWFRKPEREEFARFTKAIYQDKPTVALVNAQFSIRDGNTLANVLAMKGVRVLVKDQFSYGAFVDGLLASVRPTVISTTAENVQMVQMIQANRADLMFVAEEEANYLIAQAGLGLNDIRVLRFADMPKGEKRHIMCSRHVPEDIIARLNKAIVSE
jgi:polar amino acid transport system substrate-binding protein